MNRTFVLWLWLVCFMGVEGVCEPGGTAAVSRDGRGEVETLDFRVMAFGDDFFEGIRFEDAWGESTLLRFNPYRRSQAYEHPKAERIISFYEEVEDERGRLSRLELARVDVSKIGERALLVFTDLPDRERGLKYTVLVVDESAEVFGPGAIRFLNLTGAQLLVLAGEERYILNGGFSGVVQSDPADRVPILFRFAVYTRGEWQPVFATRRQSHEETGTLFILKPPMERNSLKIRVNALVESLN